MWHANKMRSVNIRVRHSYREAVGIEVNPIPIVFKKESKYEDIVLEVFWRGEA